MASQTSRNTPPADRPNLAGNSPDKIRERIQLLYGEKNHDGLRDEAVTLANKLDLTQRHLHKLSRYREALRDKLEALTAPEYYSVVITGVERNGRWMAEVAGLGHARVQVVVHPEVDPGKLIVGAMGLVTREKNCLLQVTAAPGRWKDVASFEKYLDSPDRALVRDRETLIAVDLACGLRDVPLTKGNLIGFDREVGMAYQRLEAPQRDHLFDEDVTDDFAQLGGLDRQIARIKRHIDFRVRHPELAAKYSLKSNVDLLEGLPGNGKTRIARCTAEYVRQIFPDRPCRFMHIEGSSDYTMWFGETEQKITERFTAARDAAREGLVVMFWDEVDAIGKRRGTDYGSGPAPDRILNTLLSQIDGIRPLANVVLMFASNRADTLDPGLLRAGRIDEKIEIPSPNRRAAHAILCCYLDGGLPLAETQSGTDALITPLLSRLFAPNGEYAEVARVKLSDGRRLPVAGRQLLSGAMLENMVQVAAQEAAVREADGGPEGLTEEDLAIALEAELAGTVSVLAPANVKSYVRAIPQDAQPIAVETVLTSSTSTYVRTR